MRILLIASSYNGLCQRVHVELEHLNHETSVALALSADDIRNAAALFQPDLIICPFLKEKIPEDVWNRHLCIIVHPGVKGDRGPSSLDWAIINDAEEWGVTALQAVEEMDAGDIWSTESFKMRSGSKASLYRREVTRAAIKAVLQTVMNFNTRGFKPEPLDYSQPDVSGQLCPLMKQSERRINWEVDNVRALLKKLHAADSAPGVLNTIHGEDYYLYGAHEEARLRGGQPGQIIARRNGAVCLAAIDGAVWISHLKRKSVEKAAVPAQKTGRQLAPDFKLRAAFVLGPVLADVPESAIDPLFVGTEKTFKEIWYEEKNEVGYLHFDFHNGAMDTEQCMRLLQSYRLALLRPTKVLVLMGGADFWSNGIHLNVIEAAEDPVEESWRNINAIDDVVFEIITTENKLTVSSVWGCAGAGGAMMLLAADKVWAREGVILNPHYKTMGLHGSEYWTYLLPKRVGAAKALELTETPLPLGMKKARAIGYVDELLPDTSEEYHAALREKAEALARSPDYSRLLAEKRERRQQDEKEKPLSAYRAAELDQMKMNFSGTLRCGDVNYHEARYNFVHKVRPKETPAHLAKHLRS